MFSHWHTLVVLYIVRFFQSFVWISRPGHQKRFHISIHNIINRFHVIRFLEKGQLKSKLHVTHLTNALLLPNYYLKMYTIWQSYMYSCTCTCVYPHHSCTCTVYVCILYTWKTHIISHTSLSSLAVYQDALHDCIRPQLRVDTYYISSVDDTCNSNV